MARKNSFEPTASETVISADIEVKGNLSAEHDVWFDGQIIGNLSSQAGITVGAQGQVVGNVKAAVVVVGGKVEGNIRAGRLLVQAGGQVRGDIHVDSLAVGDGAYVNGNIRMAEPRSKKQESKQQDTDDVQR